MGAVSAEGAGAAGLPSLTAALISAARQAAYFCFAAVSVASSPNWRSTSKKRLLAYNAFAVAASLRPDRSRASALLKIRDANPSM